MSKLTKLFKVGSALLAGAGAVIGTTTIAETVKETIELKDVYEVVEGETIYRYKDINGTITILTAEEYASYKTSGTTEKTTELTELTLTKDDLDVDGIARLANYLDFVYDKSGTLYAIKVKSSKVKKIEYEYSEMYSSYALNGTFSSYGMLELVYQDISKTDGLYFTIGQITEDNYEVKTEITAITDFYIFYFENVAGYSKLTFEDLFETIIISVEK